jgi:hypothetical protein
VLAIHIRLGHNLLESCLDIVKHEPALYLQEAANRHEFRSALDRELKGTRALGSLGSDEHPGNELDSRHPGLLLRSSAHL